MTDASLPPRAQPRRAPWNTAGWYSIFVLTVITLFAVVDRQVLVLQAEPIRIALRLSDLQLGLLQGTGVALFTTLAAYPLAWMIDRFERRWVLIGCLITWSTAVVACGFSRSFIPLLLASSMVAAGEAGLTPLVYSLIPDLFARAQRQMANSMFAVATITGGALAMVICGQMIGAVQHFGGDWTWAKGFSTWQLSFFVAALPAPLMILVILTLPIPRKRLSEPVTGGEADLPQADEASDESEPFSAFVRRHALTVFGLYGGVGLSGLGYGAFTSWIVVICMRLYGQTPAQVGSAMGLASFAAMPLGFVFSVGLSRWIGPKIGPSFPIRVLWMGMAISTMLLATTALTTSAVQIYVIVTLAYVVVTTSNMIMPAAVQNVSPPRHRARMIALQGIIATTCAAGAAPLVGWMSDHFHTGPRGLLLASLSVAIPTLLVSSAILWGCEGPYAKTAAATGGPPARP